VYKALIVLSSVEGSGGVEKRTNKKMKKSRVVSELFSVNSRRGSERGK